MLLRLLQDPFLMLPVEKAEGKQRRKESKTGKEEPGKQRGGKAWANSCTASWHHGSWAAVVPALRRRCWVEGASLRQET